MDYDTVRLDDENNAVVIIDQTKLPGKIEIISLHTAQEIWNAIYLLQVRGAPAIGVAAAYGIYVLAKRMDTEDYDTFYREFVRQKEYLDSSRPTAVNLSWALNRMQRVVEAHSGETVAQIKEALHRESVAIQEEDIWVCRMIGEHGLKNDNEAKYIARHEVYCTLQDVVEQTAMRDSSPQANMAPRRRRSIWERNAVIIFVYLRMRPDPCCRAPD